MEDSSWPVVGLSVISLTKGLLFVSFQTGICTCISPRAGAPHLRLRTVNEAGIWIGKVIK
jgi:hypothetical protein